MTPSGSRAPNNARWLRKGTAEPGENAGGDHGEADEAGEDAVAVLDHRVGIERGDRLAVALGPVRAAEAGAGEAHARAGEDDQRERSEGDEGHLGVEVRRDLEAVCQANRTVRHHASGLPLMRSAYVVSSPPWPPRAWRLCRRRGRFDQELDQVFDFLG